jgi:hypothetical protein
MRHAVLCVVCTVCGVHMMCVLYCAHLQRQDQVHHDLDVRALQVEHEEDALDQEGQQ